jgi:hypothetical protein
LRAEADLVRKPATARIAAACLHEKARLPEGSRLCVCGVARFIEGDDARVHRDDQPGGTWCVGVRCLLDGTHSLWLRPQVGAKPNHGFFGCQHLVAKIRAARPPTWREASGVDAATMRRIARDTTRAAMHAFRGKCFFRGVSRTTQRECALAFRARAAARRGCAAALNGACSAGKKDSSPGAFFAPHKAELRGIAQAFAVRRRCDAGAHRARKPDRRRPEQVAPCAAATLHRARRDSHRTPKTKPAAQWRPVVRGMQARLQWSSSSSSSA